MLGLVKYSFKEPIRILSQRYGAQPGLKVFLKWKLGRWKGYGGQPKGFEGKCQVITLYIIYKMYKISYKVNEE